MAASARMSRKGSESTASHGIDSSIIIAAERKRQTAQGLSPIERTFGKVEIAMSAVTLAELVHGVARANTPEIRTARRAFIDELKMLVPVHPITDSTAEIAGRISAEQLNTRHFQKIPGLQMVSL